MINNGYDKQSSRHKQNDWVIWREKVGKEIHGNVWQICVMTNDFPRLLFYVFCVSLIICIYYYLYLGLGKYNI